MKDVRRKAELKHGDRNIVDMTAIATSSPEHLRAIARRLRKDVPELEPATATRLAPVVAQMLNESTAAFVKHAIETTWEIAVDRLKPRKSQTDAK